MSIENNKEITLVESLDSDDAIFLLDIDEILPGDDELLPGDVLQEAQNAEQGALLTKSIKRYYEVYKAFITGIKIKKIKIIKKDLLIAYFTVFS